MAGADGKFLMHSPKFRLCPFNMSCVLGSQDDYIHSIVQFLISIQLICAVSFKVAKAKSVFSNQAPCVSSLSFCK
jgi:hypothetical protein